MIVIDENFVGMWFMNLSQTVDWMGSLMMDEGGFKMVYRFRYYDSEDPGNDPYSGKDKKSWYEVKITDRTLDEAIKVARDMAEMLRVASVGTGYNPELDEIMMGAGGPAGVLEEMKKRDWAHAREGTPEEIVELMEEQTAGFSGKIRKGGVN